MTAQLLASCITSGALGFILGSVAVHQFHIWAKLKRANIKHELEMASAAAGFRVIKVKFQRFENGC